MKFTKIEIFQGFSEFITKVYAILIQRNELIKRDEQTSIAFKFLLKNPNKAFP